MIHDTKNLFNQKFVANGYQVLILNTQQLAYDVKDLKHSFNKDKELQAYLVRSTKTIIVNENKQSQ